MIEKKIEAEQIKEESRKWELLNDEIGKVVFGQEEVIRKIAIGLLSNGHLLLEGVPGLAKTTLVKTLANCVGLSFARIQFTPDLLPSDLLGTSIFNPKTQEFETKKGPIFSNLILADEINRAPAKVQSALLEAMEEHQVTIAGTSFKLDYPLMVLATQNPVDQEGTYSLPEAQRDRFMFKVLLDYPTRADEKMILHKQEIRPTLKQVLHKEEILFAQKCVDSIYVDDKIADYILDLVTCTRSNTKLFANMKNQVQYGASPRASISLFQAAKAHAFLERRHFVTPDDVKSVAIEVLAHRLILSYEGELEGLTPEKVVRMLLEKVPTP